jgi:hypothetical protein
MYYEYHDFNNAAAYFDGEAAAEWAELAHVVEELTPQLQPSDQAGKQGTAIFDPKATNACLTTSAANLGWHKVPVPRSLEAFGVDWDAGKNAVLAEWQFSNYPFLWNNVIRTEAVFKSRTALAQVAPVKALVVVTKGICFPASNSTLYYEQACAQLDVVTDLGVFDIPIRLVGLMIQPGATELVASWNTYPGRYNRADGVKETKPFAVTWQSLSRRGHSATRLKQL